MFGLLTFSPSHALQFGKGLLPSKGLHMFVDRQSAGKQLGHALTPRRFNNPVVLALPRGGVPVAYEVAKILQAPLDVLVVRKIGAPINPEFAIGAIGENNALVVNQLVRRQLGVSDTELERLIARAQVDLDRRISRYRHGKPLINLAGHDVILVDDGMATGSTAAVAVTTLRAMNPDRIVVAVPTASEEAVDYLEGLAEEVISLETPINSGSVGQRYERFNEISDEEVENYLNPEFTGRFVNGNKAAIDQEIEIPLTHGASLSGNLSLPQGCMGLVVFAHGSGSSRLSERNIAVAKALQRDGFGTLLFDLLTEQEAQDRRNVFDIQLLAQRLITARDWLRNQETTRNLALGYFGASTGAAAALVAAANDHTIAAIVSRGGRPDLAGLSLQLVKAPTLLIVGGRDHEVLELNRYAKKHLLCRSDLQIISGATHLFEEPGTLSDVAKIASQWFRKYLASSQIVSHRSA